MIFALTGVSARKINEQTIQYFYQFGKVTQVNELSGRIIVNSLRQI